MSAIAVRDGDGAVLMQNWDWHPDLAPSRLVWTVDQGDGRWFATFTEAGILGKVGLNSDGLSLCLNLLATSDDGGLDRPADAPRAATHPRALLDRG